MKSREKVLYRFWSRILQINLYRWAYSKRQAKSYFKDQEIKKTGSYSSNLNGSDYLISIQEERRES